MPYVIRHLDATRIFGALAQLGERLHGMQEAERAELSSSTKFYTLVV